MSGEVVRREFVEGKLRAGRLRFYTTSLSAFESIVTRHCGCTPMASSCLVPDNEVRYSHLNNAHFWKSVVLDVPHWSVHLTLQQSCSPLSSDFYPAVQI